MAKRSINIEDLPANNLKSAAEPIERVTTGEVKKTKRKVSSQFYQDIHGIIGNLYEEVILPGIKSGITEFIQRGIEMIIYPGEGGGRSRSKVGRGRTNYSGLYNSPSTTNSRQKRHSSGRDRRNVNPLDDVYFSNKADASNALGQLHELIAKYSLATVGDFYSLAGVTGNLIDESYAWEDLSSARIRRYSDGYLIEFPEPMFTGG